MYLGPSAAWAGPSSGAKTTAVRPLRIAPGQARRPATIVFAGGNLAAAPRQQAALDENIMPLDYFAIASKPAAVLPLEA
jgi:hypothetical protein